MRIKISVVHGENEFCNFDIILFLKGGENLTKTVFSIIQRFRIVFRRKTFCFGNFLFLVYVIFFSFQKMKDFIL